MKNNYSFRKREFLNPVSTNHTSYIFAHVESSNGGEYKHGNNLIFLADCYHRIMLEFFLGTKRDRVLSLKKINKLIDTLTQFRDALTTESELIEKGE
jgi:hypothetical protein